MAYQIQYVDVFGSEGFSGNALAVVTADEAMNTECMQRIARWLNLAETTFLLPPSDPDADYQVRIFTCERELPFAGHPTLGSCQAWLASGNMPRERGVIIQQSAIGLVSIRQISDMLFFSAPPLLRSGAPSEDELTTAADFLNISADSIVESQWVDNGPGWLGIRLHSAEAVLSLAPKAGWETPIKIGVFGPYPPDSPAAFEVRAFIQEKSGGVIEDPVTGSLNASLGQWIFSAGMASHDYIATQGAALGRKGRIVVQQDDAGQVWVGGTSRLHIRGTLAL